MPSPLSRLMHVVLILMLVSGTSHAQALDPHDTFEAECLSCHGHAGGFARRYLRLDGTTPLTSGGETVAEFLVHHRGGLPDLVIEQFVAMFRMQLSSGALFANPAKRCLFCHDRAHDFAHRKLVLRDGKLFGRYTDRDVAGFLPGHARLTPAEAAEIYTILEGFLLPPR
ncbi:hypothetical protein [uncultured Roseovarius sp.]|uniref:hypothetical protein n=1 Tax=Roseovarius sp. TaxID=1486281 RepID=UPI0025F3B293|nr:hypothetical protein [uncultured Roseovarius sp.]